MKAEEALGNLKKAKEELGSFISSISDKEKEKQFSKARDKLSVTINDFEAFTQSPERRSQNPDIPRNVEDLIPKSKIDNMDIAQIDKLEIAVLDMIYGRGKRWPPRFLFWLTVASTLIGIAFPLIWNALDKNVWYFSLESAVNLAAGICCDAGGIGGAIGTCCSIKMAGSKLRSVAGIVFMSIGILGVFITSLLAGLIPFAGGKIYYTMLECMTLVLAFIGIIFTIISSSNKRN